MYVSPTSTRFSDGRSTPAMRATTPPRYFWRCLCRGLRLQITRITPLRRTILQCSQIFFTDVRTFMGAAPSLVPVDDPAAGQVVRRQLDRHLVPRQDLDEVHPHLARDVGQHLVAVLELHAEHRVGERLDHRALDLDALFLRHG